MWKNYSLIAAANDYGFNFLFWTLQDAQRRGDRDLIARLESCESLEDADVACPRPGAWQ